jgi:hypothetical protein
MEREGVRERIEALRGAVESKMRTTRDARFPGLSAYPLTIALTYGQKRCRIVREESQRSVCGFVDLETGDILYPASWKAPAKHARGNVFAEDFGLSAFGDYAVKTLR